MISIADAKKKLTTLGIPTHIQTDLCAFLDGSLVMDPRKMTTQVIAFFENRLSANHLGYLAKDQANGKWGTSTDAAFAELCLNFGVPWKPGELIGKRHVLALLDGSIPSKVIQTAKGIILAVLYYTQRDSETGHAWRMCFSSTCAMLLNFMIPGILPAKNGDDKYLKKLMSLSIGADTTIYTCQLATLKHFGLKKVSFRQDLTEKDIEEQIKKKIPVPVGILHHGTVDNPIGGGHWVLIIGLTTDGKGYVVNDPFGELDLVSGVYVSTDGKGVVYSKKNFVPRWRVHGTGGWGIIAA